jgi:hypothetical protein
MMRRRRGYEVTNIDETNQAKGFLEEAADQIVIDAKKLLETGGKWIYGVILLS